MSSIISFGIVRISGMSKKVLSSYAGLGVGLAVVLTVGLYAIWSSFEAGNDIALDSSDNVFVTGQTQSSNYPTTTGAFDETFNVVAGSDVFVTKLKSDLSGPLLASTYIGGSDGDSGQAIALDNSYNVFVTGHTYSSDYPTTTGAFDETFNGGIFTSDVFVTKLNSDLSGPLLASTFIGESSVEIGSAIALDSSDNVFVTGLTSSRNYPTTTGAFDETYNGGFSDVFVTKLNSDLSGPLLASTFIGGSFTDSGQAIALDSSYNVFVTGSTGSSDYPTTTGAFDETFNGSDVFVTKLNSDLSGPLLASTFIGSGAGNGIILDSSNNVFVTGSTASTDYPTTTGAFDETHNGSRDVFVTKLNSDLSGPLLASTYIGGSDGDSGQAIALDSSYNVFVTGSTASSDYPTTTGAFDETYSGDQDVFVTKFTSDLAAGKLNYNLLEPTIVGTQEDDVIIGTPDDDIIHGLGGNDRIAGLGGNDIICGGDGDNKIFGGDGEDKVIGGKW